MIKANLSVCLSAILIYNYSITYVDLLYFSESEQVNSDNYVAISSEVIAPPIFRNEICVFVLLRYITQNMRMVQHLTVVRIRLNKDLFTYSY